MFFLLISVLPANAQITEFFIKCPSDAPCPPGSTPPSCWPKKANKWYHVSGANVRYLPAEYTAALIDTNYASVFKSAGGDVRNYCTTSMGGGDIQFPIVSCTDNSNNLYYLSNYLGVSTGNPSTFPNLPNWTPINYSRKQIKKYLLDTSAHTDIQNAWGYFSGKTYRPRDCSTIELGTDKSTSKFPKNLVLYCAESGRQGFYRVNDGNNGILKFSSGINTDIGNYVPSWKTGSVAKDQMNAFSPNSACAFTAAGVRSGACSLPSEIFYVSSCTAAGAVFLPSKRQSATAPEQIDGQYYTCENDALPSKRIFQYSLSGNRLREISADPTYSAWQDLLATAPSIGDCSKYSFAVGYDFTSGTISLKKRELGLLKKRAVISFKAGAPQLVKFELMKIPCTKNCPPNANALLVGPVTCHNDNTKFANILKDDRKDDGNLVQNCVRQLLLLCGNGEYKQGESIGLGFNLTPQECTKHYNDLKKLSNLKTESKNILEICATSDTDSVACYNAFTAAYKDKKPYGRIENVDTIMELNSYLSVSEGSPFAS